jgi:hypothetical protein
MQGAREGAREGVTAPARISLQTRCMMRSLFLTSATSSRLPSLQGASGSRAVVPARGSVAIGSPSPVANPPDGSALSCSPASPSSHATTRAHLAAQRRRWRGHARCALGPDVHTCPDVGLVLSDRRWPGGRSRLCPLHTAWVPPVLLGIPCSAGGAPGPRWQPEPPACQLQTAAATTWSCCAFEDQAAACIHTGLLKMVARIRAVNGCLTAERSVTVSEMLRHDSIR